MCWEPFGTYCILQPNWGLDDFRCCKIARNQGWHELYSQSPSTTIAIHSFDISFFLLIKVAQLPHKPYVPPPPATRCLMTFLACFQALVEHIPAKRRMDANEQCEENMAICFIPWGILWWYGKLWRYTYQWNCAYILYMVEIIMQTYPMYTTWTIIYKGSIIALLLLRMGWGWNIVALRSAPSCFKLLLISVSALCNFFKSSTCHAAVASQKTYHVWHDSDHITTGVSYFFSQIVGFLWLSQFHPMTLQPLNMFNIAISQIAPPSADWWSDCPPCSAAPLPGPKLLKNGCFCMAGPSSLALLV